MSEQALKVEAAVTRSLPDQVVDRVWGWFTSVRLALLLILAITTGSVIGAAIAQAPPPALESEQQFSLWLDQVRDKYGMWTELFARLDFFRVFSSVWFRSLVALLVANVLVCTLHRTPRLLQAVRNVPSVRMPDRLFERAPLRVSGDIQTVSAEQALTRLQAAFRRRRYHVRVEHDGNTVHLIAEKNRYYRLGTLLTHAGIVSVLIGAIWGGVGGWRDSQFVVAEGQERAVGHESGLSIRLDSFVDEYYTGGGGIPKDYRSNVVLLKDGQEVKSGTVRVNEPVTYEGVRVHQAFYGPAAVLRVTDPASGAVLFDDALPLAWRTQERPAGSVVLAEPGLEVFVIGPASAFLDPVVRPGELRLEVYRLGGTQPLAVENVRQGVAQTVADLEFTFLRESRFTGLQVVKDPSLPLVWAGCALIVLGSITVLYFPHRVLWARLQSRQRGAMQLRMAAPRERGLPLDSEFRQLARAAGLGQGHAGHEPGRSQ